MEQGCKPLILRFGSGSRRSGSTISLRSGSTKFRTKPIYEPVHNRFNIYRKRGTIHHNYVKVSKYLQNVGKLVLLIFTFFQKQFSSNFFVLLIKVSQFFFKTPQNNVIIVQIKKHQTASKFMLQQRRKLFFRFVSGKRF